MSIETNLPGHVSDELATLIESMLDDAEEPVTLGMVLSAMYSGFYDHLVEEERLQADKETLAGEIKLLIEDYGSDLLAQQFVRVRPSDNLSAVIQALMSRRDSEAPPTLGQVREAMINGLVAELVGHGDIDADEDETLLAEVEHLISHFGEYALAEDLLA